VHGNGGPANSNIVNTTQNEFDYYVWRIERAKENG
jgi:hypothetical protein